MRIAVLHNLPSGGGMRSLVAVLRHLATQHDVELFLPAGAERTFLGPEASARSVRVFPWDEAELGPDLSPPRRVARMYRRVALLAPAYRTIARAIDAGGFDAVLVNPCGVFYTPPALLDLKTPSVFLMQEIFRWAEEAEIRRPYRNRLRRALGNALYGHLKRTLRRRSRAAALHATRVIANSRFAAETIARSYHLAPRVEYPEVDAERFCPGGARGRQVLSVGGIEPIKGLDFLIRSLARMDRASRPPLLLLGDRALADEQRYLVALAAGLGVELEIRTRVTEDELVAAYRSARAFLYAPIREPLGYGALEAQACGTPVVAVAEGGVRETVADGVGGLLVARHEEAFAAALERVLGDPDLARRLSQGARAHVLAHWAGTGFGARIEGHLAAVAGRS